MRAISNPATRCFKDLKGREGFRLILGEYLRRAGGEGAAFSEADMDRIIAEVARDRREEAMYFDWWRVFHIVHYGSAEARRLAMEITWMLSVLTAWLYQQAQATPDDHALCVKIKEMWWTAEMAERLLADYARLRALVEAFGEIHGVDMTLLLRREEYLLSEHITLYNGLARALDAALAENPQTVDGKEMASSYFIPLTLTPDLPADLKARLKAAMEKHYDAQKVYTFIMDAFDRSLYVV